MQRIIKILVITLIFMSTSCSTSNKCQKLQSEKVDIHLVENKKEAFIQKIEILIDCEYDSIDKEVLLGNNEDGILINLLIQVFEEYNTKSSPPKSIRFKDIKQFIDILTNSEEYKIGRQIVIAKNKIMDKPAKLSAWGKDYKLLIQMNLTEFDIAQIKKIIEKNDNSNWTYHEVFQELWAIYDSTNTMRCPTPSYDGFVLPYNLIAYFELSEGIKCSKISNKPILLYFSGHASVESRKFEFYVMSDDEILNLLKQKFIITNLNIDDKHDALPQYQIYSERTNDTIKQIGKINKYYQKELFNDDIQPAFYIIDSLGNQITDSYYFDKSIESFKVFLEEGLENYYKQ